MWGKLNLINIPFVDYREAELTKNVPEIPDNIGTEDEPLSYNSLIVYRKDGSWFFRNPQSYWLADMWLRGDFYFQKRLTIGYVKITGSS